MCFMRRFVRTDCQALDRFLRLNSRSRCWLAKAGKAMSRKRKAVPLIEVAAVHELDSDSDEDDGSGGQGTGATSTVSNLSDSWAGIERV